MFVADFGAIEAVFNREIVKTMVMMTREVLCCGQVQIGGVGAGSPNSDIILAYV
jgi:hypothetical protein